MKRHVLPAAVRLVLAVGVAAALPVAHIQWGETYPGDGQQASGFIFIFLLIGCVAAALFVALGSLAQFLLRRRAVVLTVLVDAVLFVGFAGALVYAGVSAKYGA